MESVTLTFERGEEHKRRVTYTEIGDKPKLGTIYPPKELVGDAERITLTIATE